MDEPTFEQMSPTMGETDTRQHVVEPHRSGAPPTEELNPQLLDMRRIQEIKQILAEAEPSTWTVETPQSAGNVIDDEQAFRRRFGRGFDWNHKQRKSLIELKRKYDLTDRQIRCLRLGGQLVPRTSGVELVPSILAPIVGWVLLAMLCLFCISMTPSVLYSHIAPWRLALGQIMLVSMCLSVTWVVTTIFILPWVILKRAGVLN